VAGLSAQLRAVQDPEPTVPRLEALAQRVLTGDIILPKFQRQFVSSQQQILDLLDSVSRNHPIRSVLLWQGAVRPVLGDSPGPRRGTRWPKASTKARVATGLAISHEGTFGQVTDTALLALPAIARQRSSLPTR
jgi:hypothetical protein